MKRLDWFKSKVGQRIYRNDTHCCAHCEKVYREGLIVHDELHATYLYDIEGDFQHDGFNLMYFETKKQADNFGAWVKNGMQKKLK